ncbi:hypothetical protein BDF20DRAFT_835247 [Mycotypha africana]|uniref:uncharacterized protein n=1 Tax=Mycotypha africana TaxID=64632 RepID=UPI0023014A04|nr:uncharacterized protein BDF20DRAFT_835247 [Mycotypha africana]KAI8979189.1 hypothetical protein BDF20DRAFT_835247 [Mycotypha africana]
MATVVKRKKSLIISTTSMNETDTNLYPEAKEEEENDITSDPLLESVAKEPMEYSQEELHDFTLSDELMELLQSVKHVCLVVLDMLLLQIVKEILPVQSKQTRRLSDPSVPNLTQSNSSILTSITHNTQLLQLQTPTSTRRVPLKRSNSTPSKSSIVFNVHNILNSRQMIYYQLPYYTLCCSVAALLNNIYCIMEIARQKDTEEGDLKGEDSYYHHDAPPLQELCDKVSHLQQRKNTAYTSPVSKNNQKLITLWHEMDSLISDICTLVTQQQQEQQPLSEPPAYQECDFPGVQKAPPTYESLQLDSSPSSYQHLAGKQSNQKNINFQEDFSFLLKAIEKLSDIAPRLENQRAGLPSVQQQKAAVGKNGRFVSPSLEGLILQIQQLALRSTSSHLFQRQRIALTSHFQKKLDFASIHHTFSRLDRGRHTNQDFISKKEKAEQNEELCLIRDLTKTTDLLIKSLENRACLYQSQRFSVNDIEDRQSFMYGLFEKVHSLESFRLDNQDAEFLPECNPQTVENDDLEQIMNCIHKLRKPCLDEQRARFFL